MPTYEAGAERDWFRGTRAHSTVSVDGRDQFELWGAFRSGPLPAACELLDASEQRARRRGHVPGVRPRRRPHRRRIVFESGTVVVVDRIDRSRPTPWSRARLPLGRSAGELDRRAAVTSSGSRGTVSERLFVRDPATALWCAARARRFPQSSAGGSRLPAVATIADEPRTRADPRPSCHRAAQCRRAGPSRLRICASELDKLGYETTLVAGRRRRRARARWSTSRTSSVSSRFTSPSCSERSRPAPDWRPSVDDLIRLIRELASGRAPHAHRQGRCGRAGRGAARRLGASDGRRAHLPRARAARVFRTGRATDVFRRIERDARRGRTDALIAVSPRGPRRSRRARRRAGGEDRRHPSRPRPRRTHVATWCARVPPCGELGVPDGSVPDRLARPDDRDQAADDLLSRHSRT